MAIFPCEPHKFSACNWAAAANDVGMNQSMFNARDALKATALWWSPIVAGFIGAFGTHLHTQSRERERGILDCKKQEYRELLTALAQSHSVILSMHAFPTEGS